MNNGHTAWVEVDTEAIRYNYQEIKRHVGPDVAVMAVIKTNGYGHGLELVAETLRNDADWFGVSTIEEGIRARPVAPDVPILVFHPCGPWNADTIIAHNLVATIDSEAGAAALSEAGRRAGKTPKAHLKLDTGMSRFGIKVDDIETLSRLLATPGVIWDGVFTHLATAAERNPSRAQIQLGAFDAALNWLAQTGFPSTLRHALNSAGLIRFPDHRLHMVRTGTLLFGQYPPNVPHTISLKPTWALKTRIVSLRMIQPGASVGYGSEWTAKRVSRIATIPIGYADGPTLLPKSVWERQGGLKGWAKSLTGRDLVLVQTPHGSAPVVGRVASQSMALDVTDLPGVQLGDIVEVPSRRLLVGEHIPRIAVTR